MELGVTLIYHPSLTRVERGLSMMIAWSGPFVMGSLL